MPPPGAAVSACTRFSKPRAAPPFAVKVVADAFPGYGNGACCSDTGRTGEYLRDRLGEVGVPDDFNLQVLRPALDDGGDRLVKLDLEGQ